MKARPDDLTDARITDALLTGWEIEADRLEHVAIGGGSYHWSVTGPDGRRWFVTVDDLDHKAWLGDTRPEVFDGLRTALETATALRWRAGLDFVVAPIPSLTRDPLRSVDSRYALAVYPFMDAPAGRWGEPLSAPAASTVVDRLIALHGSTPWVPNARTAPVDVPRRAQLQRALDGLSVQWSGGPLAEPARALLSVHEASLRHLIRTFDDLRGRVGSSARPLVITHGETHPGNILWSDRAPLLIDWDTVGLAVPERDLWMIVDDSREALRRYADGTGHAVDDDGLELYRIRWTLDDLSIFIERVRADLEPSPDTEHAWRGITVILEQVAV